MMRYAIVGIVVLGLAGCELPAPKHGAALEQINDELKQAAEQKPKVAQPDAVAKALLPPLQVELPKAQGRPPEPRFDLVVNNAPAAQVFMGIVSGTRYSMLVSPEVTGTISVNLKDVTVMEALEAIREIYGYEYKVSGTRIYIQSLALQTRVFRINYLAGERKGSSNIRVLSGSVTDTPTTGMPGMAGAISPVGNLTPGSYSRALEASRISTTSTSDFWAELATSLKAIVAGEGRNVVLSPQSGVIVVRATPAEQRQVDEFLRAAQLSVERQVILEAKILNVQLNEGNQAGINWARFADGGHRVSLGANANQIQLPGGQIVPGNTLGSVLGSGLAQAGGVTAFSGTAGGLFSLAFQTNSFAALLTFLDTQGQVHVLSSPRIATLNNQQAVLKVGTDAFFVTNITNSSTSTASGTTNAPSITLQPFFSGIVLDVTPEIDDQDNVILHVHPAVSDVTQDNKEIDLGTSLGGTLKLPLARSTVSETDSVVRAQDGQIVAIGGLMQQTTADNRTGVTGVGDIPILGGLFRQSSRSNQKQELVILLKATIVRDGHDWGQDVADVRQRIEAMGQKGAERP
jgi:MSHA biogenesis protein MshL